MKRVEFEVTFGKNKNMKANFRTVVSDHYAKHGYPDHASIKPLDRQEDYVILGRMKGQISNVTSFKMIGTC